MHLAFSSSACPNKWPPSLRSAKDIAVKNRGSLAVEKQCVSQQDHAAAWLQKRAPWTEPAGLQVSRGAPQPPRTCMSSCLSQPWDQRGGGLLLALWRPQGTSHVVAAKGVGRAPPSLSPAHLPVNSQTPGPSSSSGPMSWVQEPLAAPHHAAPHEQGCSVQSLPRPFLRSPSAPTASPGTASLMGVF